MRRVEAPARSVPTRLWEGWKDLSHYIGDFQARLLLTVFYYVIAAPFALVARLTDPLQARRRRAPAAWVARQDPERTLQRARLLY